MEKEMKWERKKDKRKKNSIGWEVINGMKREGKRRKRKNS